MAAPLDLRYREPLKKTQLGRGSFGVVYEALDLVTGHLVAIKRVDLIGVGEDRIVSLIAEISLMKRLSHPNIVKYLGASRSEQTVSIYLEFIAGGSLAHLLQRYGPLPESLVRIYTRDMLAGLQYLHQSRIAHRDIKCENLLLSCQGIVKLADFGTSKQSDGMTGTLAGTPNFMAPEVARGDSYDPFMSDIWAVGVTVLQMLTGNVPYSDDPRFEHASLMTILNLIANTDIVPSFPSGISEPMDNFLRCCIQRNPALRWPVDALVGHGFFAVEELASPHPPAQPAIVVAPMPHPPSAGGHAGALSPTSGSGSLLGPVDPFRGRSGSRPSSAEITGATQTIHGRVPHHLPSLGGGGL